MSQYSNFGDANPLTPDIVDPVDQCVGNTFFTKTGIYGANMQKDFCPRFMAQRCAAKWDANCEAYLMSSNYDSGGNLNINKNFLEQVARKKYCHLNRDAPGTQCALKCESFNPSGQTSVSICENVGVQNWLDTKKQFDLAGDFPQSAKLTPVSPLYMDKCPEICDAKETPATDALGPNDIVLNKCIENGACDRVLADLAYNSVKNNLKVTNPAFQKLIDYSKLNVPININAAVKVAESYGVPPAVALEAMKVAKYGVADVGNPVLRSGEMGSVLELQNPESAGINQDLLRMENNYDLPVKEGFYKLSEISPMENDQLLGDSASNATIPATPVSTPTPTHTPISTPHDNKNKDYIFPILILVVLVGLLLYLVFSNKN